MSNNEAEGDFVPNGLVRRNTSQVPVWHERNLLSLDGGGVRGYWSLLVLEKLMRAIGEEEIEQAKEANDEVTHDLHSFRPHNLPQHVTQCRPRMPEDCDSDELINYHAQRFLPCHYFDLICGSSTGSLIAIMLSRFRMTVQDCIEEYEAMSNMIFGNPRWISQRNIGIVPWPKYSASAMEDAFREVTERRDEKPSATTSRPPPEIGTYPGTCSMFATTLMRTKNEMTLDKPHLLRSYYHPERKSVRKAFTWKINFDESRTNTRIAVWLVARAATAAPLYFKEVKIKDDKGQVIYFSDGGFGQTNNPTQQGINELRTIHRRIVDDESVPGALGVILSVGTARADNAKSGKSIFKRVKKAFSTATDPQTVASFIEQQNLRNYWRFNDKEGLDMELDDWKPNKFSKSPGQQTLALMRAGFNTWAVKEANQNKLRNCAKELVQRRRLRTLDRARWERFALVTEFTCPCSDCHDTAFQTRDDYGEHFRINHSPSDSAYKTPEIKTWAYPKRKKSRSSNATSRSSTG